MPNLRGIPGKPRLRIARTSNYHYYYPAHAQRMRRSVTDIYISIARAYCAIMSLALRRSAIITCICVQLVAMVFLVYREGVQLPLVAMVLREASALMRISSIIIIRMSFSASNIIVTVVVPLVCVCVCVCLFVVFCHHVHLDPEI